MNESFAQALRSLWPISAKMLGWRPDEFWRATPEELFSALVDPAHPTTESINRETIRTMMEREVNG